MWKLEFWTFTESPFLFMSSTIYFSGFKKGTCCTECRRLVAAETVVRDTRTSSTMSKDTEREKKNVQNIKMCWTLSGIWCCPHSASTTKWSHIAKPNAKLLKNWLFTLWDLGLAHWCVVRCWHSPIQRHIEAYFLTCGVNAKWAIMTRSYSRDFVFSGENKFLAFRIGMSAEAWDVSESQKPLRNP